MSFRTAQSAMVGATDGPKLANRRSPRQIDVVVIGAGHAGLAASYRLTQQGIEHVVLEARGIAQRWRHERWDSLHLLTPNWMLDLPGMPYTGSDPHGYMHKDVLAQYLHDYARLIKAPVKVDTRVHQLRVCGAADKPQYAVCTTQGEWRTRAVVIATGAFAKPQLPSLAGSLPEDIVQLSSGDYRNPAALPQGGVLVVGASATGLQLAAEIQASGRQVTLAVGEHVRMPRQIGDKDIYWWLTRSGVFTESATEVDDITRARRLPSPQLIGRAGQTLDLNGLQDVGVQLAGRMVGLQGRKVQFSGSLANHCKSADLKLNRLLERFSEWGVSADISLPDTTVEATRVGKSPLHGGLGSDFKSVVWATGFKPDYGWLDLDVCTPKGGLRHNDGVLDAPGVYALGLPVMRSRASTFVYGANADTQAVVQELSSYLHTSSRFRAA